MRKGAQQFGEWPGSLTGLSAGGYYPRCHGFPLGMSVNPRSNLTRRTPEGPIEKRSSKDVLAYFIVYVVPERCLRYGNSSNKRLSCPLVPACDQHIFCAWPMQVAAYMMGHMEWQWCMSLQFWLVIVLRNTHAVGRIFGNSKDPVSLHLGDSAAHTGPRRQRNNSNAFTLVIFAQVQSLKQRLHLQI